MNETLLQSRTSGLDAAIAAVADRISPSVAEVRTRGHGGGAGVVWDANGLIVTNHHVAPNDFADVTLADGRAFSGPVVARNPANDLAVVKVEGRDLPAAPIGDARSLRAGEIVLAVGHPFGIRAAVTVGVVHTALTRPRDGAGRDLIQADILLGPGNSGGPLTDARGRVVGINAMVNGRLAFAVPGYLAERLIAAGRAPVLGIQVTEVDLPPALAAAARGSRRGVLVSGLTEGGPADAAGVLIGDILTGVEGVIIGDLADLQAALTAHPEAAVRLAILRGGVPIDVIVRRGTRGLRAA